MSKRPESRQPKRKSLQAKLTWLVLASVSLAVTLVAVVSSVRDGRREAAQQTRHMQATAAVIASVAGEATGAKDAGRAFRAIRSINTMPEFTYGRIETADGFLLAEVGSGARLTRDVQVAGDGEASILATLVSRTVEVSAPVTLAGRKVGQVTLLGRLEGLWGRLASSLALGLGVALIAAGVGLAFARRMQKKIAGPILALTEAVGQVRDTQSFDRAVEVTADDEVGALVDGFNAMLGEIRERDAAITAHMAGLERTVAERTADLVEARDAADAANSAKSDFLATMSHEIRTPMNGIMVMAEMLAAGEVAPRQRRFAEVIAKSGSSLLAIINDILDFSKIEAGKMDLELAPVDVGDIADDVASLFWERARSKGLDLAAYVDPSVPALIEGDAVRLRQIVGNLVNNAIKFTEAGGVLIEVAAPSPGTLKVRVHDSGIGIAEDKLGSLFSAFTQADQSTTRKFGGTGLGLAICKRLVEAMGGEVTVRSTLGKGSVFGFDVPVTVLEPATAWPKFEGGVDLRLSGPASAKAARSYLRKAGLSLEGGDLVLADPAEVPERGDRTCPVICLGEYGDAAPAALQREGRADAVLVQPLRRRDLMQLLEAWAAGRPMGEAIAQGHAEEAASTPSFAGARVLVADDSAVNREVALEALSRLGITAEVAQDGLQAVAAVRDGAFDLVLMDGSMPEMDGYQASLEIRRMEAERGAARLPIVALTAHVVGASADSWREADMDAVLHKPFILASMAKTLRMFLTPSEEPTVETPGPVAAVEPGPIAANSDLLDPDVTAELARMAAAGRGDFVARVQGLYRDNAPTAAKAAAEALADGDAAEATRAAHALKSMSLNIGARAVAELCARIEAEGREGRTDASLAPQIGALLAGTLEALGAAPEAKTPVDPELALMAELEKAAGRGELSLAYQPKVARDGMTIYGAEALIRWTHGKLGPVSPAVFIPMAERHGKIGAITDWVLRTLMAEAALAPGLIIGFNASASEFADPAFADRVARRIAEAGFDPGRLEIEVTETAILGDGEQVRRTMDRLHELGLTIALDDFGVGYSSLSHLRLYPFDTLKIDKAFIDHCVGDVQSATLVHAVVSIGRALGMKVVAEGVETEDQAKFLKVAGVHAMQGWLYGKPAPMAELSRLLAEQAAA